MLLDGILYLWFFLFWKQLFQIKCSYIYSKFKSNSCKNIKRAKLGRKEKFKAQNQLQPHWILCHVIQMSRNSQTTRLSYHFDYLFRITIGRIKDTSNIQLLLSIRLMLHEKATFSLGDMIYVLWLVTYLYRCYTMDHVLWTIFHDP